MKSKEKVFEAEKTPEQILNWYIEFNRNNLSKDGKKPTDVEVLLAAKKHCQKDLQTFQDIREKVNFSFGNTIVQYEGILKLF